MARMTPAEKAAQKEAAREAAQAERLAQATAEFRERFLADKATPVLTREAGYADLVSGERNAVAWTLVLLVRDFTRATEQLVRELKGCAQDVQDGLARVEKGRDAFWHSNGLSGRRALDIDRYDRERETLRKAIVEVGYATGWYVPEVYSVAENEARAASLQLDVVAAGGGFGVRKDGLWFHAETAEFLAVGTLYETEDAAWQALHVAAYGRPVAAH